MFLYMFQYGVLITCPIKECLNIGSNKECWLINVPLRNVYVIKKRRKRFLPSVRFEPGTDRVTGQDLTTEPPGYSIIGLLS